MNFKTHIIEVTASFLFYFLLVGGYSEKKSSKYLRKYYSKHFVATKN